MLHNTSLMLDGQLDSLQFVHWPNNKSLYFPAVEHFKQVLLEVHMKSARKENLSYYVDVWTYSNSTDKRNTSKLLGLYPSSLVLSH